MSSLRGHPVLGHSILYTIIVEKREKIKSIFSKKLDSIYEKIKQPEMEFKEFEPRFKSAKTRFKLSAGLNLETFDTILRGTNHI